MTLTLTLTQFALWLLNAKPVTIVFEACGMSNYWKQRATAFGHNAQLISAKLVSVVRQNQRSVIRIQYQGPLLS
jgi:transposase